MYLVLNYKLVLFGNYLIKRFDILFGFINRFNLVFSVSSTPVSREEETGVTKMQEEISKTGIFG